MALTKEYLCNMTLLGVHSFVHVLSCWSERLLGGRRKQGPRSTVRERPHVQPSQAWGQGEFSAPGILQKWTLSSGSLSRAVSANYSLAYNPAPVSLPSTITWAVESRALESLSERFKCFLKEGLRTLSWMRVGLNKKRERKCLNKYINSAYDIPVGQNALKDTGSICDIFLMTDYESTMTRNAPSVIFRMLR